MTEGAERDDDADPALAGASGDDVSAGTSVSGVGGEILTTADPDAELRPPYEQGAVKGWGRDAAETDVEPPPATDGTGQSEKPAG